MNGRQDGARFRVVRTILMAGVLLLALGGDQIALAQERDLAEAPSSPAITILTLNIWHNQGDWPARLEYMVDEIGALQPDVILLQEVLQNPELPNQAHTIAERLGYPHVHFASVDPEDAPKRYGNAIVSRHPILEASSRKLEPLNDYRVAAHARIEFEGRPVNVYSTHLHYSGDAPGTEVRRRQIEDLLDFIEATRGGYPVVLGGDFNAPPDTPEMALITARYVDIAQVTDGWNEGGGYTLNPAMGHEKRRIDYLFAGPMVEPVAAARVLDQPRIDPGRTQGEAPSAAGTSSVADTVWVSDHFGVLGTFSLARADFLEDLQERTFRWFWEQTDSEKGLTPDRAPSRTFSSIAAIGFGLTAYPIGVERGYITREQARERTLNTLRFFWNAPQDSTARGTTGYKGFFYHFLEFDTGERFQTNELSTIDTALLMGGILFAAEYFDQFNQKEAEIRAYADSLYRRVEWDWFQRDDGLITMAWRPERGFGGAAYEGYDEAMILYLLALASPTHPIDPKAWDAFTSTYRWEDFYGYEHVNFSPLFGHQYSHLWVDFRGIQDAYMRERGIDYFENSRRATYAQREYGIDNPRGFEGYSGEIWGWTASDGPANTIAEIDGESIQFRTYFARGVSALYIEDDGTIVPTAAGGSIPFAPEITIPALKAMHDRYGDHLYNEYGFRDAFNPTFRHVQGVETESGHVDPELGWFDGDQLGIDQGAIVIMIENYRSGLVWDVMRKSDVIIRGLCRAGFSGGWLEGRCD